MLGLSGVRHDKREGCSRGRLRPWPSAGSVISSGCALGHPESRVCQAESSSSKPSKVLGKASSNFRAMAPRLEPHMAEVQTHEPAGDAAGTQKTRPNESKMSHFVGR